MSGEGLVPLSFRRGVYEAEYGNAVYVSGPRARFAWDLDMREWIPLELVTRQWVRAAEDCDEPESDPPSLGVFIPRGGAR